MRTDNPFPLSSRAAKLFEEICQHVPRLPLTAGEVTVPDSVEAEVRTCPPAEFLGLESGDPDAVECLRAGLLLRAECLDAAHAIAQRVKDSDGEYWHAILHRREPDYGNSKYWFRRVGHHPVFDQLSLELTGEGTAWRPEVFVDLCEACHRGRRRDLGDTLESLQREEICALLRHGVARALRSGETPL